MATRCQVFVGVVTLSMLWVVVGYSLVFEGNFSKVFFRTGKGPLPAVSCGGAFASSRCVVIVPLCGLSSIRPEPRMSPSSAFPWALSLCPLPLLFHPTT